jgi:hypothetical protein
MMLLAPTILALTMKDVARGCGTLIEAAKQALPISIIADPVPALSALSSRAS